MIKDRLARATSEERLSNHILACGDCSDNPHYGPVRQSSFTLVHLGDMIGSVLF